MTTVRHAAEAIIARIAEIHALPSLPPRARGDVSPVWLEMANLEATWMRACDASEGTPAPSAGAPPRGEGGSDNGDGGESKDASSLAMATRRFAPLQRLLHARRDLGSCLGGRLGGEVEAVAGADSERDNGNRGGGGGGSGGAVVDDHVLTQEELERVELQLWVCSSELCPAAGALGDAIADTLALVARAKRATTAVADAFWARRIVVTGRTRLPSSGSGGSGGGGREEQEDRGGDGGRHGEPGAGGSGGGAAGTADDAQFSCDEDGDVIGGDMPAAIDPAPMWDRILSLARAHSDTATTPSHDAGALATEALCAAAHGDLAFLVREGSGAAGRGSGTPPLIADYHRGAAPIDAVPIEATAALASAAHFVRRRVRLVRAVDDALASISELQEDPRFMVHSREPRTGRSDASEFVGSISAWGASEGRRVASAAFRCVDGVEGTEHAAELAGACDFLVEAARRLRERIEDRDAASSDDDDDASGDEGDSTARSDAPVSRVPKARRGAGGGGARTDRTGSHAMPRTRRKAGGVRGRRDDGSSSPRAPVAEAVDVYGDTAERTADPELTDDDKSNMRSGPIAQSLLLHHLLCIALFVAGHALLVWVPAWRTEAIDAAPVCMKGESWERCVMRRYAGIQFAPTSQEGGGTNGDGDDDDED